MVSALIAVGVASLIVAAAGLAGLQTTAPPPTVNVKVTITDSRVGVSPKSGARGGLARFIIVNLGSKPYTFKLGARGAGQIGFARLLRPKEQKVLLVFLDYRSKVAYSVVGESVPGARGFFTIS
jgi:hypothetical protein